MKKKFLTYSKKTLSVFLAVLMLMTCWVFVPGEHNHASAANVAVSYKATINFDVTTKLSYGGEAYVEYYYITDEGGFDYEAGLQQKYITTSFTNSGTAAKGNGYSLSTDVPGFPVNLVITVVADTWSNPCLKLQSFYVGEINVINGWSGSVQEKTRNWAQSAGSMDNITWNWSNPSWTSSSTMSGTSVQVPAHGSRTASWSTKASWKDQYGVTWPQSSVSYKFDSANGVTVSQSDGTITGVTATSDAITNITSGTTKDITVTASGAGKTQTAKITLNAPTKDILYENLFSFSDWYYSDSSSYNDSNVVSDVNAGTIKINNPTTDSSTEYTTTATTSTHPASYYSIPVTGGSSYYFTCKTENATSTEVFFMWKDANGAGLSYPSVYFNGNGTQWAEFTAPENAASVELRFDNNTDGTNVTFSDIAVYEKTRADELDLKNWSVRPVKKTYSYNATSAASASLDKPERTGYSFAGWKDSNGVAYTGETMKQSKTVYSSWTANVYDIGYDNLFSLSDWSNTTSIKSSNSANGTISYDVEAGTITAESTANGEVYSIYGSATDYFIDVEPNTEYIFEADMNLDKGDKGQMFVFFYDANRAGLTGAIQNGSTVNNPHIGIYPTSNGTHSITFTTPANCTQMGVRVGATNVGTKATYSNIGFYKKADYDAYAKDYTKVREPFKYGDAKTFITPRREGYVFDGWYTADGKKVTSTEGYSASDVVYAHWTKQFAVTFKNWDGTVLKTQYVAPEAAATAPTATPTKAPDDNWEYSFSAWDKEFTNVTEDMTVTATFTQTAHPENKIEYSIDEAPDCETNGTISKYCANCQYYWHNGAYFEDTTGEFAGKLGHNFTKVVENSSTGIEGVHTVQCSRNGCKYGENGKPATTTEAHNFVADSTKDTTATCTVKGKAYFKCACLEEKEVEGLLDENNHVNTEIRNAYPAECEKDGYTGDKYCKDCGKELEKGTAIAALKHEYTNYVSNNDATCFADGTETAKCDLCGVKTDTRTDENSQLTHEYTDYVYDEGSAKCEENGTETASCNHGCGTTDTREAKDTALEHEYTNYVYNEGTATCLADGTETATCDLCGVKTDTRTATGTKLAHVYTNYVYNEGTAKCEENGTETASCNYGCGTTDTREAENTALEHDFTGEYTYDAENDKHQQLCVKCKDSYGVGTEKDAWADCTWTYTNKEAGKHTAACVCGNSEEQFCSGGTATCTAPAVCQYCNTAYGTTADHVYTGTEKYLYKATDATCTANETYYKYCIGCEKTSKGTDYEATYEKEGTMLPHTYTGNTWYDGAELAEEAKCEVNEKYYVYCSVCKASSKGTTGEATFEKEGTALEHIWVNPQYNGEDTLEHTFTCERGCGETMKASCMDSAVSFDSVPATCISEGYDVVQCTACSHTWNINYVPALGHDYTKKLRTEEYLEAAANCEHANIYWYACSRCERSAEEITEGEVYTGVKDENNQIVLSYLNGEVREHNWVMEVADEYLASGATCTAAAKYYYHCSYEDCDAKDTTRTFSNGSSLGHDFTEQITDDAHLVSAADCVNGSKYYYDCSRCEENAKDDANSADYIYELDDCAGHKMTHTAAVNANCDHAGNYEYWYCDTCKTYFKDVKGNEAYLGQSATVIKKRDHDIENVAYKAATCEQDGNPAYKYCKYDDCSYTTYPDVLPDGYKATGHNFTGAYTYDSVFNYHSKLCVNGCGKSGMVVDGEQVEWNVTYNEDDVAVITGGVECDFTYKAETKDGVHSHANTCVCGNNSTKIYSDEETFVEKVAPNCTEKGYDSFKCPDEECGMTWKKNEVAALGHTAAATATSNGDGTHSVYCTVEGCGYKISTEKCSGGTATCKDKAVCSVCNTAYGETTDHTYTTEWVYQNDASCGVNGTEKNTCSVCNTEETREAKDTALKHDMIDELVYTIENWKDANGNSLAPEGFDVELKAPTCKDEGLAISYCKRCSYYQTKIQAKDTSAHDWEKDADGELVWSVVGGDCATGVTLKNVCTVCGKSQTKTEEGKHSWALSFESRPTCVENGYRIWKCNVCDFTLNEHYGYNGELPEGYSNEDLAPLGEAGHKFVDTGVVKAATCSEPAKRVEKCLNCKVERYIDAEGSEALGHSLVHYEANDADCVYEGNVEHWVCGRCDAVYADEAGTQALESVVIPTKAHADNDGDGKCDECYRVLYTGDDGEGSCGCICHKDNFLMKILFKIVNFFWKLFKISKTCECGAVHW